MKVYILYYYSKLDAEDDYPGERIGIYAGTIAAIQQIPPGFTSAEKKPGGPWIFSKGLEQYTLEEADVL